MVTVFGISIDQSLDNVVYASNEPTGEAQVAAQISHSNSTGSSSLLRRNDEIETATSKINDTTINPKAIGQPTGLDQKTYDTLIDELLHVGKRSNHLDSKVNIDGEIRYHYSSNSGAERWSRDSSGIRVYLGFHTEFYPGWRVYGRMEGKQNIENYDNDFDFSRLYAAGKLGTSMLQVGAFGYLMADGNIYDSSFDGIRADFIGPVNYTVSLGKTDDTKNNAIFTALYNDFDYNLEASVYHFKYQRETVSSKSNTIWTLNGIYNFSNFSLGAMILGSNLKDSKGNNNGYVMSLKYGDSKTWRQGTYGIFAKYYNQPQYTYIAHGMNGLGGSMQGFKGYGVGMDYTISENLVAGIEHYTLTDQIVGDKSKSWWSHLTYYF